MKHKTTDAVERTANQTVRLDWGTKDGVKSMRSGFTDQRLTTHGGLVVWTRFFARCGRAAGEALFGLHRWALAELPVRREGYTLDLDAFPLLHEDGQPESVRVGYTRKGLKPCHRPIVAALAEVQDITHDGVRLVVLRQRISERPHAGGKQLLEVWRRYNGRADIENRIEELGAQFGLKGLCCRSFWATAAACHLAICAYHLCVGLQRRLGQPQRAELTTLRGACFPVPRSSATPPASPR